MQEEGDFPQSDFPQSDPDPYGIAIYYGNSSAASIPQMSDMDDMELAFGESDPHDNRRRMQYVTEEPNADVQYRCSKTSDAVPEQFIPAMTKTRLQQVRNASACL